jgi:RNA polymerase sigma-70 factor (ECF subfamily)
MTTTEIENPSVRPDRSEACADIPDEEIVQRVLEGDVDLFEILLRRYDQRVYRAARAVLGDDQEAEDVTQEAWVRAFRHLGQFEKRARFSTWLTRIALHEAWARSRRARNRRSLEETPSWEEKLVSRSSSPEGDAAGGELRAFLESAVEGLPEFYRVVFVLRAIEGLSTAEAAVALELSEDAVKTRLSRARALLRRELTARAGPGLAQAFPFFGRRCDRMVDAVMSRIRTDLGLAPGALRI